MSIDPEMDGGFVASPSNPEKVDAKMRERMRGWVAFVAMAVFAGEIFFCMFIVATSNDMNATIGVIKELAEIFFVPTVAIVGSVTGFYFGRN